MQSLVGVVLIAVGVVLVLRAASMTLRSGGDLVAMLTISPAAERSAAVRALAKQVEAKVLQLRDMGYAHTPRTSAAFALRFSFCLSNALVKPVDLTNPFWTPNGETVVPHLEQQHGP